MYVGMSVVNEPEDDSRVLRAAG
uniref:GNAT family N-acetyltransferase n=1 Tax=Heterorhabditis bacteriophora TaxID=37862 RepID=A0A1I7X754_HETBA